MDVSAIIVEYGNTEIIKAAIASVRDNLADLEYEILVVSNSVYNSEVRAKLKQEFREVCFIFNEDNIGFSKANNQGIKQSKGDFVLLINPDAKLCDRSVLCAIELMGCQKKVAATGPMIVDKFGTVQDSCRNFLTFGQLLARSLKRLLRLETGGIIENSIISEAQPVDWVSGACVLVRRAAIDSSGYMDERYFMYIEDMDWCRTFWFNGWEVWYEPTWKVEHNAGRGSSSGLSVSNKLMWIHFASYCKYLLKWLGKPTRQTEIKKSTWRTIR